MTRIITIMIVVLLSFQTLAIEGGELDEIFNFYQITENIGIAGQPLANQFTDIANANYSTVINLAMHDSNNAIPEEGNIVTSLGMTYIHIPVPWEAPSIAHLKKFIGVMNASGNENIFVHCAANYRASAFTHRYLTLIKKMSPKKATSPILLQWLPEMDENWKLIMELDPKDF